MTVPGKGGRPGLPADQRRVSFGVSLSREQKKKFHQLGGSAWLRQQIDAAPEPPPSGPAALDGWLRRTA